MLHTHTEDGNMGWTCPKCKKENTAHVSHPQVEHPGHERIDTGVIALPTCECGTRTFLNAAFSDEDLEARNMREPIFEGGQDNYKIVGWNKTESHAAAHRHMAVAQKMKALGKGG